MCVAYACQCMSSLSDDGEDWALEVFASIPSTLQNEFGESPFFFALKRSRWGLLRLLQSAGKSDAPRLSYTATSEQLPSRKVITFLMKKAR